MICISEYEEYDDESLDLFIESLEFKMTCRACPEQYDVFEDGVQVAYVRLRHGSLRVDVPDCGGETIYTHEFLDNKKGCFSRDRQRLK